MDYGVNVSEYKNKTVGLYGGKFFPPHKGHISFALEAAEQVDVLFVAVQYDEEYERGLCEGTNFTPVPPVLRVRWLTEIFKDYPNIRVFGDYEKRTPDHLIDPVLQETYRNILKTCGGKIDIVFSNTREYDDYFNFVMPESKHVVIMENREIYNISATQIREKGVFKNWKYLPDPVRKHYSKRVAFCGWESAGKTFTSHMTAMNNDYTYVEEYGREYYDEIGSYDGVAIPEDYINITSGHIQKLLHAEPTPIICVDTDMIYTQFYHTLSENGEIHPVLDALIKSNADKIDHYLFFEPYEVFADDGTRFRLAMEERKIMSDRLKEFYAFYGKEVVIISGSGPERFKQVEAFFNDLL